MSHHHSYEFFIVNLSITINISFSDHFINFFISQFFTKSGHDLSKFSSGNKLVSISVKDFKGFSEFFFSISILDLSGHKGKKLWEINCPVPVSVDFVDHVLEFSFSWILTEGSHNGSEFFGGNSTISIFIEKSESFFEFRDLFFGELFRHFWLDMICKIYYLIYKFKNVA